MDERTPVEGVLGNSLLAWGLMCFGALKFHTSGSARLQPLSFRLQKKDLAKLAHGNALDARLDQIDHCQPIERVFVMGCGRSGTWLLTGLMSTFSDTCVVAKEVPIELFGQLTTTGRALVLKRNSTSFKRMSNIPQRIKVAYVIRHPYDVLTSHNATSGRTYHVEVSRWLGEMAALKWALESGRKDFRVILYEELVTDPIRIQSQLGNALGLDIGVPASDMSKIFRPSAEAKSAMHGLRTIGTQSVYRYKNDPTAIAYLKSIRSELGATLDWVSNHFAYETSLG